MPSTVDPFTFGNDSCLLEQGLSPRSSSASVGQPQRIKTNQTDYRKRHGELRSNHQCQMFVAAYALGQMTLFFAS